MPGSFQGNDRYFIDDLQTVIQPQTAFDVGVGAGKIGRLIKENAPECQTIGFEAYAPNITPEVLKSYLKVHNVDFKDWIYAKQDWFMDLIVFGDCLEHFLHSDALNVLDICNYRAKWIAIFTPLSFIQGEVGGNTFERHQCVISLNDLNRYNVVHYFKNLETNIYYCLLRGLAA